MPFDRVIRGLVSKSLALLICIVALGATAVPVAGATTARTFSVGSYTMIYWLSSASAKSFPLTLKRNGHFTITTPLSKTTGTWKYSADVVSLTTPRVPDDHWVYTARLVGKNLGSRSQPGKVMFDGKRWKAHWYAVPKSSLTASAISPTAATTSAPGSSPTGTTSAGRLLWNLEALLRATFGDNQPSSSDLTASGPTNQSDPPSNLAPGSYLDFNCAGVVCSPLSTYSPYWYTFSDPTDSSFHVSKQNYQGWSFGNDPEPVLINGRIVACDPQESTFLIRYFDASSLTLACKAPLSGDN
jgi:hypothetical protein